MVGVHLVLLVDPGLVAVGPQRTQRAVRNPGGLGRLGLLFAPTKPVQISEVASAELGGNKATWITAMFSDLRRHPEVKSLIWYDLRKQTDWPITSSHRASLAFAAGAAGRTLAPRP